MRFGPRLQLGLASVAIIGVAVLAAAVASTVSLLLGVVVFLVTAPVLVALGHNYETAGGRLREQNDRLLFDWCDSGAVSWTRRLYRHLPASPRCRVCLVPFGGFGRIFRIVPSRKNPNFCGSCIDASPEGVHDMEVGVFFADIRGFTAWSSSQPASVVAARVMSFYDLANRVLARDDALIEFVGDQVMALYLPGFPSLRGRTADVMLAAAERLVSEVMLDQDLHPLRIGVGMNFGVASIGNVRKGGQKDFTAVGDVVNTGSRLQAAAGPDEIVVAEAVFEKLTMKPGAVERRLLEVKGKSEALPVYVLQPL